MARRFKLNHHEISLSDTLCFAINFLRSYLLSPVKLSLSLCKKVYQVLASFSRIFSKSTKEEGRGANGMRAFEI